jgi:diguanylate cyclase
MENNYQDQAAEYMRLALPLMKKHGLALTPTNYTIWFEYVSGNNFALREAIDKHLNESDEPLTDKHCRELYERFFDPNKNASALAEMRQDIRRILTDILGQMTNGLNSSTSAGDNLSRILDDLNEDMTQQQLHQVIQSVVIETRSIAAANQSMTSQLSSIVAEVKDLRKGLDDARADAKTDTLTQIANRRGFDEAMTKVINESEAIGSQFCLVMADVDSFKALNDEHGHFVGDQVLRVIARSLKNLVKGHDIVARYGGEEFAIIFRNTTIQNAVKITNKIREDIASKRIQRKDTQQSLGQITVSFGVADYVSSESVESILQRADRALYMSKRNGRNRVTEAQPPIL